MEEQNKEPIVAERKLEKEIMPKRTEDLEDSETRTAGPNKTRGFMSQLISDNLHRWKEEHKRIDEVYEKKMTVIESEEKDASEKVRMMEQAAQDQRNAHLKTRATHFGEIVVVVGLEFATAVSVYKLKQKYAGISFDF